MGCTRVPTWKIKYICVISEETYYRLLQGSSAGQAVRPVGLCRSFVHVQVGAPRWPLMARPGAHGGYKPAAHGWMRTVAEPPGSARAHAPSGGGPRVSVAPACRAGARRVGSGTCAGKRRDASRRSRRGAAASPPPHPPPRLGRRGRAVAHHCRGAAWGAGADAQRPHQARAGRRHGRRHGHRRWRWHAAVGPPMVGDSGAASAASRRSMG